MVRGARRIVAKSSLAFQRATTRVALLTGTIPRAPCGRPGRQVWPILPNLANRCAKNETSNVCIYVGAIIILRSPALLKTIYNYETSGIKYVMKVDARCMDSSGSEQNTNLIQ